MQRGPSDRNSHKAEDDEGKGRIRDRMELRAIAGSSGGFPDRLPLVHIWISVSIFGGLLFQSYDTHRIL